MGFLTGVRELSSGWCPIIWPIVPGFDPQSDSAPLVQSLGFFTPWWVWDTVVGLTMRLSFPHSSELGNCLRRDISIKI